MSKSLIKQVISRTIKGLNKIFSLNACLGTDSAQSRSFYSRMIWNGHRHTGKSNFLMTLGPKVSIWNCIADLVSESASSYVLPSPATAPSSPRGYPTYPSSSLEITILNFLNRCILLPPIRSITQQGIRVKSGWCSNETMEIMGTISPSPIYGRGQG